MISSKLQEYSNQLNKLHFIIKSFHETFPDNFLECGILPCEHCHGSGLEVQGIESNLKAWNVGDYCTHCKGIGYTGMKMETKYNCNKCNGEGCSICSYTGKLSWIDSLLEG